MNIIIWVQYDPIGDLKVNLSHCELYISWSSDFMLHLEDNLMDDYHSSGLWVSMAQHFTLK